MEAPTPLAAAQVAEITAGIRHIHNGVVEMANRRDKALLVLHNYSQDDDSHHKAWCLDQVARALLGPQYDAWIAAWCDGEDGPNTYSWDEGIAP